MSKINTTTINHGTISSPYTVVNSGGGGGYGGCGGQSNWWAQTSNATLTADRISAEEIIVNGENITPIITTIKKIEQRLGILRPNVELEDRWEELKQLGDRYRELEKELLGKEKIWDIISS